MEDEDGPAVRATSCLIAGVPSVDSGGENQPVDRWRNAGLQMVYFIRGRGNVSQNQITLRSQIHWIIWVWDHCYYNPHLLRITEITSQTTPHLLFSSLQLQQATETEQTEASVLRTRAPTND